MNKIVTALAALGLVISLAACGDKGSNTPPNPAPIPTPCPPGGGAGCR